MSEGEGKWRPDVENDGSDTGQPQKSDESVFKIGKSGFSNTENNVEVGENEKWETTYHLSLFFNSDFYTIGKLANKLGAGHPEWFRKIETGRGIRIEYSPELVLLIKNDFETNKVPKDWVKLIDLVSLLKVEDYVIRHIAEKYKKEHPEWLKLFRTEEGRFLEYLHPDLIAIIRSELEGRERAPEGWMNAFALSKTGIGSRDTIDSIAARYRDDHPEWFKFFYPETGSATEYLHPDLIAIIRSELEGRERAPEGWMNAFALSKTGIGSRDTINKHAEQHRAEHPEWFKEFWPIKGPSGEYLHPNLVEIIRQELNKFEFAPDGWMNRSQISVLETGGDKIINRIVGPYRTSHPEWFKEYKTVTGLKIEHFHPELVAIIIAILRSRKKPPTGWKTVFDVVKTGVGGQNVITPIAERYRVSNPEWLKKYWAPGSPELEYFHPDLVKIISDELEGKERPPEGWMHVFALSKTGIGSRGSIWKAAEKYRAAHPEWFRKYWPAAGGKVEYFHPDLIEAIRSDLGRFEVAPDDWMNIFELSRIGFAKRDAIKKIADRYRSAHQEWYKKFRRNGFVTEFLSPELIELIKDECYKKSEKKNASISIESFVSDLSVGESVDSKKFQVLVGVLGGSHALDILYKFRPEYKGLPPEYVKGILADYLGDFLVKSQKFTLDNIGVAVEYLSDLSLREGLFEALKEHCLSYYFEQRRKDPNRTSQDIIYDYLDEIVEKFHHLNNKDLDDVIQDVIRYYDSVLKDFRKPERFVDSLDPNREFPDINQRINMKELAEKRRLLIADEMGLGKSASVIMAKEQLGIGCALVVAPSNVVSTWRRYLSDRGEDGGYFKSGEAPRVLEVSSVEDLVGVTADQYDYVLMSQERMNERYSQALASLEYDMLVVDEVHKLKNLEGQRTNELIELSKKVEGEGKYLALLSGTPAPNKVEDIAISLKLLYPEKFATWDDRDLVRQIIQGDLVDLRSLLLPRMQAKKLEEGVEMPALSEEKVETELSPMETDIYEVLLEDDELEAAQKMSMLRQFLMNPDLLDATPGIRSAKIERVGNDLRECFAKNNKAVLFVNGYIEGVIRGKDNIITKFGLPQDVEVMVVHGGNRGEREEIQKKFRETTGKMLLVVSGQTADVGVDFTSAETVFTYNEPWTEYDRRQQVSRVYRPGLKHDLAVRTFVTKNTLEEGIHEYIGRKYQAIEKLLHGIPIQELEKQLLREDEQSANPDLEVGRELAEYYFSSWDKLMRIFAHVKEIGEEGFREFLSEYGKDYADCYLDLGNRSYQANANRVAGTLVGSMLKERGGKPEETRILDVASGPEMLRQHIGDALQKRVISVDANKYHLRAKEEQVVQSAVASWRELPFADKSFDYLNLALALHYSSFVPSRGKLERLEVLKEANRVLKPGGRAVISFIYSLDLRDVSKFHEFAEGLGFKIVDEYSGEVAEGDEYRSRVITLEKVADFNNSPESVLDKIDVKDYAGLKFKKTEAKLKGQRNIIDHFGLRGRKFEIDFNALDSAVRKEEREMLAQGNALKEKYGGVINIPKSEIINNKFVRIKVGEKYLLFKKLEKGSGVIIVK